VSAPRDIQQRTKLRPESGKERGLVVTINSEFYLRCRLDKIQLFGQLFLCSF